MKRESNMEILTEKLKNLTKEGNPVIMGTPFSIIVLLGSEHSKPFYGKIENHKFQITLNRPLFPTPYILEGNLNNTNCENRIDYKIKPIWFGYLWIRIIPFLFISFIATILISSRTSFSDSHWKINLIFFLICLIIASLPILITYRLKTKMEKIFNAELNNKRT